MIRRFVNVLVPAGVAGAVIGATYTGRRLGIVSPAAWFWLWPSLVAVAFLGFSILAWMSQAKRWLWPLGTGFVVQTLGIVLLLTRTFENSWEPLVWTLGAVAVVLVVMGIVWVIAWQRARWLEKKMVAGMGVDRGADQQQLGRIREDMMNALSLLRRAGKGRNAIYELPWHLVIGRPAAGKTVAIKNSGLGLPVRKDWVKGVGGTYTCDWFFTNDMIFLDTPGKWVTDGADADARGYWTTLLKLLRKFRGKRPLDGLVVVVPADDLLGKSREELEEQASNVRTVIDLLHEELRFRFPIYILVSKTDLVEGFTDFFYGLPARRRHEILGWSNVNPNEHRVPDLVRKGFHRVSRRLDDFRIEMLSKVASRSRNRRLFFFNEEFRRLEEPLVEFSKVLFYRDPSLETPVFRGFYFTSGTQGEGSPVGQAMASLAQSLGVTQRQVQAPAEDEPKRSYFLLELFRDLMVGDEGLVGRTGFQRWRLRRNTMFATFLPAGLAVLFLILSFTALMMNRSTYSSIQTEVPTLVSDLKEAARTADPSRVQEALASTGKIRRYHRNMTGFTLFRGFGMRRPGDLADDTFQIYRHRFQDGVLRPTLAAAEDFAVDEARSCLDRIDVLHSVVWLRMGRRLQWTDDLAGFDKVWGLSPDEAAEAREQLLLQFGYMKERIPESETGTLLPGFSIRRVSRAIQDQCGAEGATSALELYRRFQSECEGAVSRQQVENCYASLHEVLRHDQQNYQRFVDHFQDLKTDLAQLEGFEPEARTGLELLEKVDIGQVKTGECLVRFVDDVVPAINSYAEESSDLLQICRDEVEQISDMGEKYRTREAVLKEQEEVLADQETELREDLKEYSTECRGAVTGFTRLDFNVLKNTVTGHRRVACLGGDEEPVQTASVSPAPAPIRRMRLKWFRSPRSVSNAYDVSALNAKRTEWSMRLEAAQTGYTGQQRQHEEEMVAREVASFMQEYSGAWKSYLTSLKLESRRGSVAAWLAELSATSEFTDLIGPAANAFSVGDPSADPPLNTIAQQVRGFSSLAGFVEGDLKEYQAMLGQISEDLAQCNRDLGFFRSYQRAVIAGNADGATLAAALKWVNLKAGPGLADGSLKNLLRQPLRDADRFVRSDNLLDRQWSDLRQLYVNDLGKSFPFAGNLQAEPAEPASVVAFLGRGSGLVTQVRRSIGNRRLSSQAASWMSRAEAYSQLLFEEGADTPKPLKVRVTIQPEAYDPEKVSKRIRLDHVRLYLGSDADYLWETEGEGLKSRSVTLNLYGGDASDYSEVSAKLSLKKGFVGRVIGSDYKGGKPVTAKSADGVWAPLKLLAAGVEGGLDAYGGGDPSLVFEVPVENEKGKVVGTVRLGFQVEGEGLQTLLLLLKDGLPAPPQSVLGN